MSPYRIFRNWVLCLHVMMLCPVASGWAQVSTVFNGHAIPLHAATAYNSVATQAGIPAFQNRKAWILQSTEPLSATRREAWRKKGILAGLNLGNNQFLVSLPSSFPVSTLSQSGVSWLEAVRAGWVASPHLQAELISASPTAEMHIQGFAIPGIPPTDIQNNWQSGWGNLKEIWTGPEPRYSITGTPDEIKNVLRSGWLVLAEPADPEIQPLVRMARISSRTQPLYHPSYFPGPGLSGKGVTVAIGDGGLVENHADLLARQSNLTSNKVLSFGDHQDHVTGIVAGGGLLFPEHAGFAPEARVFNLQTSATITQATFLREALGVTLTNNSYGVSLNCNRAGNYNSTAAFVDNQSSQYPDLLHVFAGGNAGTSTCGSFPSGFHTISEGYPTAKNVLTVGSCLFQDGETATSSRGPLRDGRLKPEIVINGNDIVSTVPFDAYGTKSGTSMAAPAVTGILALLTERYRQLFQNQNPEAAFLKALVCNTAKDLGPAHADFTFGFGRVDARKARQVLEARQFRSGTLSSAGNQTLSLVVPPGAKGIRVMLSWSDPASTPNTSRALVHDLDLSVQNGTGDVILPWNPRVDQDAVRERDSLNNMEQVTLSVQAGELLQIRVRAGALSEGSQRYWLVYDWERPELVLVSPVSGERWYANASNSVAWDQTGLENETGQIEMSLDSVNWLVSSPEFPLSTSVRSWSQIGISGPRKIWLRLRSGSGALRMYSDAVGVLLVPPLGGIQAQTCIQSAQITWNPQPQVSRYQIFRLEETRGLWKEVGATTETRFSISGLEAGKNHWFSILPWYGDVPGLRSRAIKIEPTQSPCPWTPDVGIIGFGGPEVGRLLTSSPLPGDIRIKIQNFGNELIFQQPCTLFYQIENLGEGAMPFFLSLGSGEIQELTLPLGLPPDQPGNWQVHCRIALAGDLRPENDSLHHTLRQLPNPPVSLPWVVNFESVPGQETIQSETGWGLPALDIGLSRGGRAKISGPLPPENGQQSRNLILDKSRIDGQTGIAIAQFTLNLVEQPDTELVLDFDWLPKGSLSSGNEVQIRSHDQADWVSVLRLWQQSYAVGDWQHVRGVNLSALLNGQNVGSSFQIRFLQSGTRNSDMQPGGGYKLDNLSISNPKNDVAVLALLSPQDDCAHPGDSNRVTIRLVNHSAPAHTPLFVGYRLPGYPVVLETVPAPAPGDSLTYTFPQALSPELSGLLSFTLWAKSFDDGYPSNDTLRNQRVFRFPTVRQLPYYEGFEDSDGSWYAYGKNNSWNWARPSKGLRVLDTAANGLKMWSTSQNGRYSSSQESWLQSPCFSIPDSTGDLQFSFNSLFQTEAEYDQTWLEMSVDGISWNKVGDTQSGTNWYNHESQSWNGEQPFWRGSSLHLPAHLLGNRQNIRFRFAFSSDVSLTGEGFALDDVHIETAFRIQEDTSFNPIGTRAGEQNWVSYGNLPDKIAMVEQADELGQITMKMRINQGPVRMLNQVPYLDRNYLIVPEVQPLAPVMVRLFVTDAEVSRLQGIDARLTSFQELGIFKYNGQNQDLDPENNTYDGQNALFIPARDVLKVPTAGGYYLQFPVSGFSEFYIASRTLSETETPLPVDILRFDSKRSPHSRQVTLSWKTAQERNLDRFELAWSCDGKLFEPVFSTPARGLNGMQDYAFSMEAPSCPAGIIYYRLQAFDVGSELAVSERNIRVFLPPLDQTEIRIDPENRHIQVKGLVGESHRLEIVDIRGVVVQRPVEISATEARLPIQLPPGIFRLRIVGEGTDSSIPFIWQP